MSIVICIVCDFEMCLLLNIYFLDGMYLRVFLFCILRIASILHVESLEMDESVAVRSSQSIMTVAPVPEWVFVVTACGHLVIILYGNVLQEKVLLSGLC